MSFPYNDGSKDRFGDPSKIDRILEAYANNNLRGLLEQTASPNPELSLPAWESLYAAIRAAFELSPYDPATGLGSTEDFCFSLLESFLDWKDKKKANGGNLPTSSQPTDGQPPVPPDVSQREGPKIFVTDLGSTS